MNHNSEKAGANILGLVMVVGVFVVVGILIAFFGRLAVMGIFLVALIGYAVGQKNPPSKPPDSNETPKR